MADIYKHGSGGTPSQQISHQNNAGIPNNEWKLMAGIDPKTNLPIKCAEPAPYKANMRKLIRIQDEQDAINSFVWYGLPNGLSSQELERMLYYKGQLCFFYHEQLDQFFFMPYALDGTIDFYGRFNTVHPVPMSGGTTDDEKKQNKALADYLYNIKLNVQKDIKLDELTLEDITNSCVLIKDYTNQLSETIIPRQQLQEGIIDIESDIVPYLRTSLKNSTGVQGMRVNDQSAYSNVIAADDAMDKAVLEGHRFVPIISAIEMQDLAGGAVIKSEEYLESLQAIDNLRLGFHGIKNGGLFQKKAHMLESEQAMNTSTANSALQDRLTQRQHFCDIANSIWGLGIWCEPAEGAIDADMDMDGTTMEDNGEQDSAGGFGTEGGAEE